MSPVNKRTPANQILKKNKWIYCYSLFLAFICIARRRTPNFAWMHAIWPHEKLLAMSHSSIFETTLIPVFRPFLHVEKVLGQLGGSKAIDWGNNLVYGVAVFAISVLIFAEFSAHKVKAPSQTIDRACTILALTVLICLPTFLVFATYGSIVDVLYPLGLILCLRAVFKMSDSISFAKHQYPSLCKKNAEITALLFGTILVLLTRPYGVFAAFLLLVLSIILRSRRSFLVIVLSFALSSPYYFIQNSATGGFILSNYGGCNLAEVFRYGDSSVLPGPLISNQLATSSFCHNVATSVLEEIRSDPVLALSKSLNPNRIRQILWPPAFAPYSTSLPQINSSKGFLVWTQSFINLILFLAIGLLFCLRVSPIFSISQTVFGPALLCTIFLLSIPMIFSFVSHSGHESLRLSILFYAPLLYCSALLPRVICKSRLSTQPS